MQALAPKDGGLRGTPCARAYSRQDYEGRGEKEGAKKKRERERRRESARALAYLEKARWGCRGREIKREQRE